MKLQTMFKNDPLLKTDFTKLDVELQEIIEGGADPYVIINHIKDGFFSVSDLVSAWNEFGSFNTTEEAIEQYMWAQRTIYA